MLGEVMSNIYKIESYCENSVNQLADFIRKSGGNCIVRGWAVISDHIFNETQTGKVLHLVSHVTDLLTDDDLYSWSVTYQQKAA